MGLKRSLIVWHDTLLLSEWYSLSRLSLAISSHPITNDISLFEVKEKGQDYYYTSNPPLMKTEDGKKKLDISPLVNDRWIGIGIGISRTWRFGKVRPNHRTFRFSQPNHGRTNLLNKSLFWTYQKMLDQNIEAKNWAFFGLQLFDGNIGLMNWIKF